MEAAVKSVPDNMTVQVNRLTQTARQALSAASRKLESAEKLPAVVGVDNDKIEETGASVQKRLTMRAGLLDQAQNELNAAKGSVASIMALKTGFSDLYELRAAAMGESREPDATRKIEALYKEALDALQAGQVEEARRAQQALKSTYDILRQEYTLQIVSRPGVPSGVWRYPEDRKSAKNYYLIVEALDAIRAEPQSADHLGRRRQDTLGQCMGVACRVSAFSKACGRTRKRMAW